MIHRAKATVAALLAILLGIALPEQTQAGGIQRSVAQAAAARVQKSAAGQAGRAMMRARRPATPVPAKLKPTVAPCRAIAVKCAGLRREAAAQRILGQRYPNERIQSETYLVNRTGKRAIDPKTRTARRIDYVMFSGGKVSRRFEVTSQKADKVAQLAKERRILTLRRNGVARRGPVYVRDRQTGKLAPVKSTPSEVIRFH